MSKQKIRGVTMYTVATPRFKFIAVALVAIAAVTCVAPARVHAASLTDVVTQPVTTSISTIQNIVAPIIQTQPVAPTVQQTAPSTTTPSQTQQSQGQATSQNQATPQTDTSTTEQSMTAPTSSAGTSSSAESQPTASVVAEAGDQSVGDMSPISYVSRQISQAKAESLYVLAGVIALVGLAVFAITTVPGRLKMTRFFKSHHLKPSRR